MQTNQSKRYSIAHLGVAMLLLSASLGVPPFVLADEPNFEDDIKPLFRDHCLKCHNADEANGDLDLSTLAATMRGGSSGIVVAAGRPESSQLFRAVAHMDGAEPMPPESDRIPDERIAILRKWIQGGLIAGKGQKSQLRSVAMFTSGENVSEAPMPVGLTKDSIAKTIRPPIPQAMDASPGAPLLAVSGNEQVLFYKVTDDGALDLLGEIPFPEGTVHAIRFSRNGTLLLAAGGRGGHSGRVVVFDVATGKRVGQWGSEVDSVLAADISAGHQFVALGGPSKSVAIFSTSSGDQLHRIKKHTDWITDLAFSPDGKLLATGDRSGGIHIWETERGAIVYTLDEHKVSITGFSWRPDGIILASTAEDGNLILWDLADGWPIKNVTAHQKKSDSRYTRMTGITDVDFSIDGRIATVGRDGMLRVFDAEAKKILESPAGRLPVSVRFLPDRERVASGSFDGTLRLWSLDQAKAVTSRVNGQ